MNASVTVAEELVTPEMAREWLNGQLGNRGLRKAIVSGWANDMRSGRWGYNPQPIMLASDGRLLDGQHRLAAVIESDTSVRLFVARNVPAESRRFIDSGSSRTTSDTLHMDYGVRNSNNNAATAVAVLNYRTMPDRTWPTASNRIKQAVIDEVASNFDEYAEAVRIGQAGTKTTASGLWLTRNSYSALWVLVQRDSAFPDLWDDWHDGVSSGANLAHGDPRLTLRNSRMTQGKGRIQFSLLACIKAWNAYVEGRQLAKLYTGSAKYLPMAVVA